MVHNQLFFLFLGKNFLVVSLSLHLDLLKSDLHFKLNGLFLNLIFHILQMFLRLFKLFLVNFGLLVYLLSFLVVLLLLSMHLSSHLKVVLLLLDLLLEELFGHFEHFYLLSGFFLHVFFLLFKLVL